MAKEKVNKSQVIRDYFAEHPEAGLTEIARALTASGVSVSPAHVNQALGGLRTKSGRRGRKPGKAASAASTKGAGKAVQSKTWEAVSLGKKLIQLCGSKDSAVELLNLL